jgi:hypothetical protein
MKRMIYKVCQLLLAFSVLTAPVMAEDATTVESLSLIDLPAPGQEPAASQAPVAEPDMAPVQDAVPSPAAAPAVDAPSVFTPGSSSSITMAQMGQPRGITLSGGQLQAGIDFTLPADQVITNAQLLLNLKVSPAMAARNTTLQLMMNGQPLGTVPLGSADSNVSSYQLEIPAAMVVSSNNISFKINDGDALLCLRDLSDKYQVTIMPNTRLDLEGQQLNIGADLSHFPRPFFDAMQMTPAAVTFAFPAKTLPEQVSAAALVASWLGIEADYRGISFNALRDTLPEKNGILFGKSGEQIGGLTLPVTQKPMLQIIDNPANPVYKLLLVVGNSDQQLRAAAWRLTQGKFPGQTASTAVENQTIPASKAYDAPRWIPTDRPVRLTELMRKDQSLTAAGIWHEPLSVAFRAAPDLFLWDGETIPVKLGYRFPTESWIDEDRSYLSLTFNGTFLHNLPVNKQGALETLWRKVGGDARQEDYNLALEPYLIYGDNQLSLYFNIQTKETAPCSVLLNNNIKSRIDENSTIDLSKTRHFSLLPNLSYFVGASFPFSRFADFAHTVLLLPENPGEAEISTLLNMAARSGNATGTSLNNNTVMFGVPTAGGNLQRLEDSHVLSVSTINKNTFNRTLLAQSPFTSNEHSFGVRERSIWQKIQSWLEGDWGSAGIAADRYFSSNEAWRGFVSFRSQWNPNRVVVMAIGSTDEQLSRLQTDLTSARVNAGIRGDVSIITDENGVRSFRVGQQFPSGQMPWYMMVVWYANQHSAFLAILGLLFATVIGLSLYALLKKRAHKRLNPQDDGK